MWGIPNEAQQLTHGMTVMQSSDHLLKYRLSDQPIVNVVEVPAQFRNPTFHVSSTNSNDAGDASAKRP